MHTLTQSKRQKTVNLRAGFILIQTQDQCTTSLPTVLNLYAKLKTKIAKVQEVFLAYVVEKTLRICNLENSQTEHAQIEPTRREDANVKGMFISDNELAVWYNEKTLIYNIHKRRVTNLLSMKGFISNCIISLSNKILFDGTDSLMIWDHTTNETSTLSFVADKTILYSVYTVDNNHFILEFKEHVAVYSLNPLKEINTLPLAYDTRISEMWNATNVIIFINSVIRIIDIFIQNLLVEKNIGAYIHALHKLDNNSIIITS
jgi:hypothetical protein